MGIVHKLTPEITNFILEKKKINPKLSCRGLVALIESQFQAKVSKSSVNAVIKSAGLSMPVGRRRTKRKYTRRIQMPPLTPPTPSEPIPTPEPTPPLPAEVLLPESVPVLDLTALKHEEIVQTEGIIEGLGAIFLKAADYLVGGSQLISGLLKTRLKIPEATLLTQTEALIYGPLFGLQPDQELSPDCGLWQLLNYRLKEKDIFSYLDALQGIRTLPLEIFRIIKNAFQEARGIKVSLFDGTVFYLDGQLHTVWSAPQVPADFSISLYNIKSYINKYFQKKMPFILFNAPGYETPTKEFFDFIFSLQHAEKGTLNLSMYGHKFEDLQAIHLEKPEHNNFIFGLWPWQFLNYRQIKAKGEFKPYTFAALKENFYLAEIEVTLSQPTINKAVILRGLALKRNLNEKVRLLILSNLNAEEISAEDLANAYLGHWPNLEEGFQDYSRKIELFTYTASSQRFFSTENLVLESESSEMKMIFSHYLKALDLFVKWHFLPEGYEEEDFASIRERFYNLSGRIERQQDRVYLTLQPPVGYAFLKELAYACRRVNEREVMFSEGRRLWLLT
jgi:hypothetical protein